MREAARARFPSLREDRDARAAARAVPAAMSPALRRVLRASGKLSLAAFTKT